MREIDIVEDRLFISKDNRYRYNSEHCAAQWKNVGAIPYLLTSLSVKSRQRIDRRYVEIDSKGEWFGDYGMVRELNDYSTNYWILKSVVKANGLKVRRGQTPHTINDVTTRCNEHQYHYSTIEVYNIDQLQPNQILIPRCRRYNRDSTNQTITQWISDNRIRVRHQSNVARVEYYDGKKFYVAMPTMSQFTNSDEYYAVLMHEIGHYIRLRCFKKYRDGKFPRFGTKQYGYEELVAELTSVILCNRFNINSNENRHLSYLYEWLTAFDPSERYATFKKASIDAEKVVAKLKFSMV